MELKFKVKGAPGLPNARSTMHWSVLAKERRDWRSAVCLAARHAMGGSWPTEPIQKATIVFDCHRSGKQPDHDNLVASIKPLLDGLQPRTVTYRRNSPIIGIGCGLIASDEPDCIGRPIVNWVKCKRGMEHVVITVADAPTSPSPPPPSDSESVQV